MTARRFFLSVSGSDGTKTMVRKMRMPARPPSSRLLAVVIPIGIVISCGGATPPSSNEDRTTDSDDSYDSDEDDGAGASQGDSGGSGNDATGGASNPDECVDGVGACTVLEACVDVADGDPICDGVEVKQCSEGGTVATAIESCPEGCQDGACLDPDRCLRGEGRCDGNCSEPVPGDPYAICPAGDDECVTSIEPTYEPGLSEYVVRLPNAQDPCDPGGQCYTVAGHKIFVDLPPDNWRRVTAPAGWGLGWGNTGKDDTNFEYNCGDLRYRCKVISFEGGIDLISLTGEAGNLRIEIVDENATCPE